MASMSSQTLLLFQSLNAAKHWQLAHEGLNIVVDFERAWVFEEFEKLERYYRLAELNDPLILTSFAMDLHHAKTWLEECRSSQLEARFVVMSEFSLALEFEWWSGGWREEISWRLIQGQRVVMLGFGEEEQRKWNEFCALECVRMVWVNQENYRWVKERGVNSDFIVLADASSSTRSLALIWGQGPTFSRPLMLSSKSQLDTRAINRFQAWWAKFRFRSRWF